VQSLIDSAGVIVLSLDQTDSLRWEVEELWRRSALDRTIFIVPPVKHEADAERRVQALGFVPGLAVPALRQRAGREVVLAARLVYPTVHLIVGRVRDDVSYETAIDAAIATIPPAQALPQLDLHFEAPSPARTVLRDTAAVGLRSIPALLLVALGWLVLVGGVIEAVSGLTQEGGTHIRNGYLPGLESRPPTRFTAADQQAVVTADASGDVQLLNFEDQRSSYRIDLDLAPSAISMGHGVIGSKAIE